MPSIRATRCSSEPRRASSASSRVSLRPSHRSRGPSRIGAATKLMPPGVPKTSDSSGQLIRQPGARAALWGWCSSSMARHSARSAADRTGRRRTVPRRGSGSRQQVFGACAWRRGRPCPRAGLGWGRGQAQLGGQLWQGLGRRGHAGLVLGIQPAVREAQAPGPARCATAPLPPAPDAASSRSPALAISSRCASDSGIHIADHFVNCVRVTGMQGRANFACWSQAVAE